MPAVAAVPTGQGCLGPNVAFVERDCSATLHSCRHLKVAKNNIFNFFMRSTAVGRRPGRRPRGRYSRRVVRRWQTVPGNIMLRAEKKYVSFGSTGTFIGNTATNLSRCYYGLPANGTQYNNRIGDKVRLTKFVGDVLFELNQGATTVGDYLAIRVIIGHTSDPYLSNVAAGTGPANWIEQNVIDQITFTAPNMNSLLYDKKDVSIVHDKMYGLNTAGGQGIRHGHFKKTFKLSRVIEFFPGSTSILKGSWFCYFVSNDPSALLGNWAGSFRIYFEDI